MFDVTPKSVTMKDVATEAGCHPSTVSLALRGDIRIPEATRKRVVQSAALLGYEANPMVSAWVSARRAGRVAGRALPLAYLDRRRADRPAGPDSLFLEAREKAKAYGFSLSKFYADDYAKNIARLSHVLRTRSVQGVLLGPDLEGCDLAGIDWAQFSIVAIGCGIASPRVHCVMENYASTLKVAFHSCLRNGWLRIGLVLSKGGGELRQGQWIGAFLREQARFLEVDDRLPVELVGVGPEGCVSRWLESNCPDVLLVDDVARWRGCGVRCIDLVRFGQVESELLENERCDLGGAAVDLLSHLVTSNARGIPARRRLVMVESLPSELERGCQSDAPFEGVSV